MKKNEMINKAAILVIDMQNDFFATEYADPAEGERVRKRLAGEINQLLACARENGTPVIFANTVLSADKADWNLRFRDTNGAICIEGTAGAELVPEIKREAEDMTVIKKRYSAFFQTNLEKLLAEMEVSRLVICGINTHACVRTAAVDAFMRDIRVFIPEECVASYDSDRHAETLDYFARRIAAVLPLSEMIKRIERDELDFRFEA